MTLVRSAEAAIVPETVGNNDDTCSLRSTPAAWSARIERDRNGGGTSDRAESSNQYFALQPLFRQLLRRTRDLVKEPFLRSGPHLSIATLAQQALEISKLVYAEFNRSEAGGVEPLAPASLLHRILECNLDRVDRLQHQFRLLETACAHADTLHRFLHDVIHGPAHQTEALTLQGLSGLISTFLRTSESERFAPVQRLLPSLALAKLNEIHGPVRARVYATGIAVAYGVMQVGRELRLREERTKLAIAAAFLQDAGCLILKPEYANEQDDSQRRMYECHPAVGAALVGGIVDCTAELPGLISQHHERLDGTGYPRRTRAAGLGELSRLLGAATRFEELRQSLERADELLWPVEEIDNAAVRELARATRAGAYDERIVVSLLADRDLETLETDSEKSSGRRVPIPAPHLPEMARTADRPKVQGQRRPEVKRALAERRQAIAARRTRQREAGNGPRTT